MASPLTRTKLDAALKKWFPDGGYEFRSAVGRPGDFAPIGFTVHHTGGSYTDSDSYLDFLFKIGRPDEGIPAQLCQFAVGASGKLYIGDFTARANHAGTGDEGTRNKISTEDYPGYTSEINPGDDDINGNPIYYGVEVMYPGTLPMKTAQYATTVRLGAMIMDTYGWTALSCFAHREHTERKWDPGQHNLATYRRDVRTLLATESEGVSELDAQESARLNWIYNANIDGDGSPATNTLLNRVLFELSRIDDRITELDQKVTNLTPTP